MHRHTHSMCSIWYESVAMRLEINDALTLKKKLKKKIELTQPALYL